MDWELLLPIGFVLLAPLGLVCGGLAVYHHCRREQSNDTPRVTVAIVAFAIQYSLVFILTVFRNYVLLPTILMFLITVALITVVRLGLQAHSKAGFRITMAGLFTLGAYICLMGSDYLQLSKSYRWP
jgi:hypothetical protein